MKITFQSPPKNVDEKMLYNILRDYKMLNCEVLVRDENGMSLFTGQPRAEADANQLKLPSMISSM